MAAAASSTARTTRGASAIAIWLFGVGSVPSRPTMQTGRYLLAAFYLFFAYLAPFSYLPVLDGGGEFHGTPKWV